MNFVQVWSIKNPMGEIFGFRFPDSHSKYRLIIELVIKYKTFLVGAFEEKPDSYSG